MRKAAVDQAFEENCVRTLESTSRSPLYNDRGDRDGALDLVEKWAPEAEAIGMEPLAKRAASIRALD
jgi:hypothetical protein